MGLLWAEIGLRIELRGGLGVTRIPRFNVLRRTAGCFLLVSGMRMDIECVARDDMIADRDFLMRQLTDDAAMTRALGRPSSAWRSEARMIA